jgi:hypothetical protein
MSELLGSQSDSADVELGDKGVGDTLKDRGTCSNATNVDSDPDHVQD